MKVHSKYSTTKLAYSNTPYNRIHVLWDSFISNLLKWQQICRTIIYTAHIVTKTHSFSLSCTRRTICKKLKNTFILRPKNFCGYLLCRVENTILWKCDPTSDFLAVYHGIHHHMLFPDCIKKKMKLLPNNSYCVVYDKIPTFPTGHSFVYARLKAYSDARIHFHGESRSQLPSSKVKPSVKQSNRCAKLMIKSPNSIFCLAKQPNVLEGF